MEGWTRFGRNRMDQNGAKKAQGLRVDVHRRVRTRPVERRIGGKHSNRSLAEVGIDGYGRLRDCQTVAMRRAIAARVTMSKMRD